LRMYFVQFRIAGTAFPIKDIEKEVKPGHLLIAAGGRTGKDGLKGANFSACR